MPRPVVDAGELDQQVTLRSRTPTSDGMGGSTTVNSDYAAGVWARILPMTGAERQAAQRVEATGVFEVAIRNRTGVQENHVVVWGTRELNVRFVRMAGNREPFLYLECEAGAVS